MSKTSITVSKIPRYFVQATVTLSKALLYGQIL